MFISDLSDSALFLAYSLLYSSTPLILTPLSSANHLLYTSLISTGCAFEPPVVTNDFKFFINASLKRLVHHTFDNFLVVSAGYISLTIFHCINNKIFFILRDASIAEEKDVNLYFLYCSYDLFDYLCALICHLHSLFTRDAVKDGLLLVYNIGACFTFYCECFMDGRLTIYSLALSLSSDKKC